MDDLKLKMSDATMGPNKYQFSIGSSLHKDYETSVSPLRTGTIWICGKEKVTFT